MTCQHALVSMKANIEKFLTEFYNTLDVVSKEQKTYVIMGDFNINLINYESHSLTEDFINTLNSLFLATNHSTN